MLVKRSKLKTKLGFWNSSQISDHSYLVNPLLMTFFQTLFSLSQNGVTKIISITAWQIIFKHVSDSNLEIWSKLGSKTHVSDTVGSLAHAFGSSTQDNFSILHTNFLCENKWATTTKNLMLWQEYVFSSKLLVHLMSYMSLFTVPEKEILVK